jgi:hypothetical protein|tara:strand:+ start:285 stop:647 length:363 start_codon:yes stop_codon:yes gene_type:complete
MEPLDKETMVELPVVKLVVEVVEQERLEVMPLVVREEQVVLVLIQFHLYLVQLFLVAEVDLVKCLLVIVEDLEDLVVEEQVVLVMEVLILTQTEQQIQVVVEVVEVMHQDVLMEVKVVLV